MSWSGSSTPRRPTCLSGYAMATPNWSDEAATEDDVPVPAIAPAPPPGPVPPGSGTTEWRSAIGAALVAVVTMLTSEDAATRERILDLIFKLSIVYVASRTVVKVTHTVAAAIAARKS